MRRLGLGAFISLCVGCCLSKRLLSVPLSLLVFGAGSWEPLIRAGLFFRRGSPHHKSPDCAGSGLAGPDWAFSVGREDHAPECEHLGARLSSWGTQ